MIESIEFTNFKALRKTTVPMAPFTLILGPNGSGKSSVLQALRAVAEVAKNVKPPTRLGPGNQPPPMLHGEAPPGMARTSLLSVTAGDPGDPIQVVPHIQVEDRRVICTFQWESKGTQVTGCFKYENEQDTRGQDAQFALNWLRRIQTFALDASAIAMPIQVHSGPLQPNGSGLPAVLDDLKDNHPERWDLILSEMRDWLPEYDHIQFDKPEGGKKAIALRTKRGGHRIPATQLSHGTLISLALLTLAYLPEPPSLVGLEEIDRGLHPRLLRRVQDALYRLSYPESCGEKRPPVQVIATTHSPYMLDLYRDHPEEVVLAEKKGLEVEMTRLSEINHFEDILGESALSEVWYSGVLGGVSVKP